MRPPAAVPLDSDRPRPLAAGEFGFERRDFDVIATALHADAGIHLPPSKANLVYSRLAKRLRALGLENFRDYCALIGSEAGADERTQMIAALTTNVTRFFREPHHFDHLKEKLFGPLVPDLRGGRRFRVWSAGCSSGQEPYSAALSLLQLLPDARSFDIRILATDINPQVLDTARRAAYPAEEVSSIPVELRRSWMEHLGSGTLRFDEALRGLVSFRLLNLMSDWPMSGPFDAIFCRNVLIYFEERTQIRLLNRMSSLLRPGGYLYLGHSERVVGPAEALLRLEGTTTYRKIGGAGP